MKNAQQRDELRDKFNLISLEMEAAGTMNTIPWWCYTRSLRLGVTQKNKEWQAYAVAMATTYYAKAPICKIRPTKPRRNEAVRV